MRNRFSENSSEETDPDPWPDFLAILRSHLSSNGYLLMTFAREDEFERARDLLLSNNYHISMSEPNKIVVPSDKIGIVGAETKDDYVIRAELPK